MKKIKVGLIQATPILFDIEKTIEKAGRLIQEAAKEGCELLLFPEAFISAYPRGLSFDTAIGRRKESGKELWLDFWNNSLEIPSKHAETLSQHIKKAGIYVVMGANERDTLNKSIYCSMIYFAPDGKIMGKHRKIKPTGTERLIWGEDNGKGLISFNTNLGTIGGLICWENLMPLARMSMYKKGVEIYLAPTADSRNSWQSSMFHIANEGRCFVLGCNQFVKKSDYPEKFQEELKNEAEIMCSGGSLIISPSGEVMAGPLFNEEGLLTAELNMDDIIKAKMDFDVIGHYSRDDIFDFKVKDQPETIEHRSTNSTQGYKV